MKNKKIMIVDDEPDILEFLSYHFRKEGYEVMVSKDAEEGLRMADQFFPNLIIADIRMPGMDGVQMCRELKNHEALKKIPVLFLTADNDEYLAISAMHAGGSQYMNKPIKPSLLSGIVADLITEEMDD